ncbi:MAG: hypothetical protein KF687_15035 [Cyclobacteriaceae bacterium]|nr:hypothetical protein [Cyclobacteriaceae bacterium]
MKSKVLSALILLFICIESFAQPPLVYSVENTGAKYTPPALPPLNQLPVVDPLTDPFMWSNGKGRSTKFRDWEKRRNEIKAEIEHYEIGRKPGKPDNLTASYSAIDSTSGMLTVRITVNGDTMSLRSKVSIPSISGPYPAVIGMNSPNGSIPADVFTSRNIARITYTHNQVTSYNNPQNTDPFYRLFPDQNIDNSGQYAAWAWGVSRIIDGLELVQANLPIDLKHIAVTGCSYAGKMALFAGAFDERIALTIAIESGGGGATAWRVSETIGNVEKLGATSNQWFKNDLFQFAGLNVSKLPYDHHELMAMVAPRALFVTGNTDYTWLANPSCYVASRATQEVYKTLGIADRFGFFIDGGHGHCAIPQTQRPAIEAFVDKFLLGKTDANTNVSIHPYPDMDYQRWYNWWRTTKPVFPGEEDNIKIWFEAECGNVGDNWEVVTDASASNGAYVTIKSGVNSEPNKAPEDVAINQVIIPFTIEKAGTYNILAKCIGPTPSDDSYWVKVDHGAFEIANGLGGTTWQWGRLITTTLTPGQHTLTITYREDGARLDKILITTSSASVIAPEISGKNCQ